MKEGSIYITLPDQTKRAVEYIELNQLKKDILWIYDENYGDIVNAFAPSYSFHLKYWEYLTLDGDKFFYESERLFYESGVLVILLCFCIEYVVVESGDQQVFSKDDFNTIIEYVKKYVPRNESLNQLKSKVLFGLEVAKSIPESAFLNNEYDHPEIEKFFDGLNEIGHDVIKEYYKTICDK